MSRTKTSLIIAIFSYLNMAINIINGIVLIPFYLNIIGDRLYGLWVASGGIIIAMSVLDLGLSKIVTQRVAVNYGGGKNNRAFRYFINGLVLYVPIIIVLLLIGIIISYYIPPIIGADSSEYELIKNCFILASLTLSLLIVNDLLRNFQNSILKSLSVNVSLFLSQLVGLISIVIMLFYLEYGLYSIALGNLVAALVAFVLNMTIAFKTLYKENANFTISKEILIDLLVNTPSVFVGKLGSSLVKKIEPTIISIFIGPTTVTFYDVTKKVAELINNLLHILIGATSTTFTNLIGEKDVRLIKKNTYLIFKILLKSIIIFVTSYIIFNEVFVKLWVGLERFLGNDVVLWIGIYISLIVLFDMLTELLMAYGKFRKTNYIILAESITRVILMVVLIRFGVEFVPISIIISLSLFISIQFLNYKNAIEFKFRFKDINLRIFDSFTFISSMLLIKLFVIDINEITLLSIVYLMPIIATIILIYIYRDKEIKHLIFKVTGYGSGKS